MIEGWQGDDYLVLFDEPEVPDITRRYDLATYLGGYEIVGLRGWDDLILRHDSRQLFTVPTVPLVQQYLASIESTIRRDQLRSDERLKGKIKWYVKPLVFGGSPTAKENVAWITLDQHTQAVKWFNQLYRTMKSAAR
jgi:hypothetical protein